MDWAMASLARRSQTIWAVLLLGSAGGAHGSANTNISFESEPLQPEVVSSSILSQRLNNALNQLSQDESELTQQLRQRFQKAHAARASLLARLISEQPDAPTMQNRSVELLTQTAKNLTKITPTQLLQCAQVQINAGRVQSQEDAARISVWVFIQQMSPLCLFTALHETDLCTALDEKFQAFLYDLNALLPNAEWSLEASSGFREFIKKWQKVLVPPALLSKNQPLLRQKQVKQHLTKFQETEPLLRRVVAVAWKEKNLSASVTSDSSAHIATPKASLPEALPISPRSIFHTDIYAEHPRHGEEHKGEEHEMLGEGLKVSERLFTVNTFWQYAERTKAVRMLSPFEDAILPPETPENSRDFWNDDIPELKINEAGKGDEPLSPQAKRTVTAKSNAAKTNYSPAHLDNKTVRSKPQQPATDTRPITPRQPIKRKRANLAINFQAPQPEESSIQQTTPITIQNDASHDPFLTLQVNIHQGAGPAASDALKEFL